MADIVMHLCAWQGELVTHCFKNKYTLQVGWADLETKPSCELHLFHCPSLQASTYQMAVLLQYNAELVLTLEHLQESTQLKPELLQQVLAVLIKAKLLVSRLIILSCVKQGLHVCIHVCMLCVLYVSLTSLVRKD